MEPDLWAPTEAAFIRQITDLLTDESESLALPPSLTVEDLRRAATELIAVRRNHGPPTESKVNALLNLLNVRVWLKNHLKYYA